MFKHMGDLAKAATFFAITFCLCAGAMALSQHVGEWGFRLVMFTPLAGVLIMMLIVTRDGYSIEGWRSLGLHRPGFKGWALALAAAAGCVGSRIRCGLAERHRHVGAAGRVRQRGRHSRSRGLDRIVTLMGGIGEEIGWRGYLLPRLEKLGLRSSLLVSGFLHGVFHLPALGTIFYHSQGDPIIVIPLFLATLTMAGVCYGYLRLTTGSVWPAALAHSAFNIYWDRLNGMTETQSPLALEYLAGESGVITLAVLSVVAAWLAWRLPAATRRQVMEVTMRSPAAVAGSLVLLLGVPLAIVAASAFENATEIIIHFALAALPCSRVGIRFRTSEVVVHAFFCRDRRSCHRLLGAGRSRPSALGPAKTSRLRCSGTAS